MLDVAVSHASNTKCMRNLQNLAQAKTVQYLLPVLNFLNSSLKFDVSDRQGPGIISTDSIQVVSRVAQSVYCLATDWTTGRSRFDPQQRREGFTSNLCVQTGSEARPASCTAGTGGPFLRG
jgi:hypothetical protein